MTPEGRIKALVKRRMKEIWPTAYHFCPVQNGMGSPSLDFLYCIQGRWVAIETKAPGLKMTGRQEATAIAMTAAGGLVFTIDGPERLERSIEAIRKLLRT